MVRGHAAAGDVGAGADLGNGLGGEGAGEWGVSALGDGGGQAGVALGEAKVILDALNPVFLLSARIAFLAEVQEVAIEDGLAHTGADVGLREAGAAEGTDGFNHGWHGPVPIGEIRVIRG